MQETQSQFSQLNLQPEVLKALDEMGFKTMTPIQEQAIPKLLAGYDFLGQAPTGTGKTAAFGIPLVNRIDPGKGYIQALVIGPTRELAQQIAEELNQIGKYKGVRAMPVYGGESVYTQKDLLRERNVDIVVGTPGRVLDHIGQLTIDLTKTRLLIMDEADEMLDMGFRPDIEAILAKAPGGRETWLFSATISPDILRIAKTYMYHPEEVRIKPQTMSAVNIQQLYYILPSEEKHRVIRNMIKTNPDLYGIVFCETKRDVVLLTRKLRERYNEIECLHGAMQQSERDKILDAFRDKKFPLLVSTDVMARGIDLEKLTHIINYAPPHDPESYIHRIGRTARKGETGTAITLFTPDQEYEFKQLQKRVGMSLDRHPDSLEEFDPNAIPADRHKRSGRGGGGKGRHGNSPSGRSRPQGSSNNGQGKKHPRRRKPKPPGTSLEKREKKE